MTDNELKAVAYFAVGVTSEGSMAGRDVSYRLSFAGNVRDGIMDPVGNSGYSFGTLQIDLGQHPEIARQMLNSYQRWATVQPDRATVELDPAAFDTTLEALQRTGRQMRAAGAHDIDRSNIDRFLASNQGVAFVHGLDMQHVNGVTAEDAIRGNGDSALERLRRTGAYLNAPEDDQAKLAGMFMKLQNQAGVGRWPGIMSRLEDGTLTSPEDIKTAIDALLPNNRNGDPDYIQSGADNTLRGVAVLNALRNASADNPLAKAWTNVVANPLVGPVVSHQPNPANPDLGLQYDTMRSLFLSPEASQRFIHAVDGGGTMSEGHPQPRNGRAQAGFYVNGGDFVHWNRNGHGVAYIGGQWSEIEPSQITRVDRGNGVIDLEITRNGPTELLLHVDPSRSTDDLGKPNMDEANSFNVNQPLNLRAELQLSPESQRLLQGSEQHIRQLAERHRLPWDAGLDNTVAAVASEARQSGLTDITHLKLSQGLIRVAQFDGQTIKEATLDARAAANTEVDQSVGRMLQADRLNQATAHPVAPAATERAPLGEPALAH